MLKNKVKQLIERHNLLQSDSKTLVALSGGADSVALLRVLLELGYDCEAAHCNFHLRGDESDRDESFVISLCQELLVPLHIQHFNTKEYAEEKGISIEMAAREQRYKWFEELRRKTDCQSVAVAHHQDDNVETLLMNLIRGTGIKGLLGIRPKNLNIIRPLLCVNRKEIIDYLQDLNQAYVTDSTNLQTDYTRNKIRLELLPLLESINPSVKQSLLQTINNLNETYPIYKMGVDAGLARITDKLGIDINKLLEEPSPQCLLYEAVAPWGFNASQVSDMMEALQGQPGKVFNADNWCIVKDRTHLIIEPKETPTPPELEMEEFHRKYNFVIPDDNNIACFDADKLEGSFSIRRCQTGDKFIPLGMKGQKLVSDFLTNLKKNIIQKSNQYVLCCDDEIIWVIGERIDNRFKITKNTKRVIVFRKKA